MLQDVRRSTSPPLYNADKLTVSWSTGICIGFFNILLHGFRESVRYKVSVGKSVRRLFNHGYGNPEVITRSVQFGDRTGTF